MLCSSHMIASSWHGVLVLLVPAGQVQGHVLVNTTSIGMHPDEGRSPMGAADLSSFEVVFDAVYVPMETQLLKVTCCHDQPA